MRASRTSVPAAVWLPWLLAGLLVACGRDVDDPHGGTAMATGPTLPSIRFVRTEATPANPGGERRVAVSLENGASLVLELEGGELLPGDVLALDVRAGAQTTGESSSESDSRAVPRGSLTFKSREAGSDRTLEVEGERWSTVRWALPSGTREVSITAKDDLRLASPRVQRPSWDAPTVILITSDTHRADHVSTIDPSSPIRTPHIDALAARGALFTDCFSSTNVTNPSHIALMTGVHPRDTKIVGNDQPLHSSANTLAEHFARAGYQTFAAMSAFHLYDELSGLGQGFDRMDTTEGFARDGRETLEIVQGWMDDAQGAPLFLWLHLFDAHAPYTVPDALEMRLREGRPDPTRASSSLPVDAAVIPAWIRKAGLTDPEYVTLLYGGEVEYLDGLLGDFLESDRVRDATIAFTSDHGESLGEQDTWWDHSGVYTPTLHVPLVLFGEGVGSGLRCAERVEQIDVGRTLLNMSGLAEVPFPGRDLRAALDESPPEEPRFALSANAGSASIETRGWLLQLYLCDSKIPSSGRTHEMGTCQLFELERDPHCETDRLREHFERATKMRAALIAWLDGAEATGLHPYNHQASEQQLAKLRELGYSGGVESMLLWWCPDKRDPDWASNPWRRAFESGGGPEILDEIERSR